MDRVNPIMTPFWLGLWSCTLGAGWLLPNHYWPWLSFHTDAWIALVLLMATVAIVFRSQGTFVWNRITLLATFLVFVPWIQYFFGIVPLAGTAWISSAYLLGFLLAMLAGARWESSDPGQFANGLFLAVGIAAILAVGLQLKQWLGLDGLELWTMGGGVQRPSANLGQPNQLGTLLLWGVLSTGWGVIHKRIGVWVALLMATYLLFGIALTGSRTAGIGVALLVAAFWFWRHLWDSRRLPWVATGLGLFYVFCVIGVGWLQIAPQVDAQSLEPALADFARTNVEIRPTAWAAFIDAVWRSPFFGYGWNQGVLAQVTVSTEHPELHGVFRYSHNLFLDFVLWCGVPLGGVISIALVWWLFKRLRAVQSSEDALLAVFLLVIANHAMLELPLHFAYFLLPVGMVMGVLNTRLAARPLFSLGRGGALGLSVAAAIFLVLIIRDYSRIEESYLTLRFEEQGIQTSSPKEPPDVLLLTQWRDYIYYARFEPRTGLTKDELDWMGNVTGLFPTARFFQKYAMALALNQRPAEASLWLQRMSKMVPEAQCLILKKMWARQSVSIPEIAAIPWPVEAERCK